MCETITKSYIDMELFSLLHCVFWLPSVHIVCVWMHSGLEIHFVPNKLSGLSREDKKIRGSAKTVSHTMGSHTLRTITDNETAFKSGILL